MDDLVRLNDIPGWFSISLQEGFRETLFAMAEKLVGTVRLSKELGTKIMDLKELMDGTRLFSVDQLLRLGEIAHTRPKVMDRYVVSVRAGRSEPCFPKLPMRPSSSLSALVGYSITNSVTFHTRERGVVLIMYGGDIAMRSHIEEVSSSAFGVTPSEVKDERLMFSSAASRLLMLAGAPTKKRILKGYRMPGWVNEADEYSVELLRALQSGRRARVIPSRRALRFRFKTVQKYADDVLEFLGDIRSLYLEQGVEVRAEPRITGMAADSDAIYAQLDIGGTWSLKGILRLGFTSEKKTEAVQKLLV